MPRWNARLYIGYISSQWHTRQPQSPRQLAAISWCRSKEQRRSAAEEAATACSDVRSTAEQQQGSTHSVWGTEGEGILEMSELWLPGNIFSPLSGGTVPEAQSGFFTWDCGWLMANK